MLIEFGRKDTTFLWIYGDFLLLFCKIILYPLWLYVFYKAYVLRSIVTDSHTVAVYRPRVEVFSIRDIVSVSVVSE